MPTVRGYERSVDLQPLRGGEQSVALTAEAAGTGIGDVVNKQAQRLFDDEINRQDQVAVMGAERSLGDWELKAMYDPQNGALAKRGKDAFGLPDAVKKDYKTASDSIGAGLSNDRQKAAFNRASQARWSDINGTLTRHVFSEVKKNDDSETENFLKNSQQAAIANIGDDARINTEMERQTAAIVDYSRRNGLGVEFVKQKTAQVVSDTNVGLIDRMIANGQDLKAKAWLDGHRDQIAGDDIAKVERWVQEGSTRGESQRQTDVILARTTGEMEAIGVANKITDPKVRDASVERVRQYYSIKDKADRQEREELTTQAAGIIDKTGTVDKIPPSQWNKLTLGERSALKSYAKQIQAGDDPKEVTEDYYNLLTRASVPELQAGFLKENLMSYVDKIPKSDLKHLMEVQASLRKGDDKSADKLLSSERVQGQIANDAILGMGLDPTPTEKTSEANRNTVLDFRRQLRANVRGLEARTGKQATDDQVQGIVDGMVIKGTVPGSSVILPDDTKRAFQLKPGETLVVKSKDIPVAERDRIKGALERKGITATDAAIVDLYNTRVNIGRGPQKPSAPRGYSNPSGEVVNQIPGQAPTPTPQASPRPTEPARTPTPAPQPTPSDRPVEAPRPDVSEIRLQRLEDYENVAREFQKASSDYLDALQGKGLSTFKLKELRDRMEQLKREAANAHSDWVNAR